MPSPVKVSDLCRRLRCLVACCGGTVVIVEDAETKEDAMDAQEDEKERPG